jgi:hypothetical protein
MTDLTKIALESLAVGSASMTLARSRMFREVRWWFHRHGGEFAWDLSKCSWCISHWLAFALVPITGPVSISGLWALDYLLTSFLVVAIAPVAALGVHRIYGALPPVLTEAEWNAVDEIEREGRMSIPKHEPEPPDAVPGPTKPDSPWRTTEKGASRERAVSDSPGEKVVLVLKMGWDEAEGAPTFQYAFRQSFIEFLITKDTAGLFRNIVADELAELAEHVRSGAIFRD